jgi:hypothetical protein
VFSRRRQATPCAPKDKVGSRLEAQLPLLPPEACGRELGSIQSGARLYPPQDLGVSRVLLRPADQAGSPRGKGLSIGLVALRDDWLKYRCISTASSTPLPRRSVGAASGRSITTSASIRPTTR